MYLGTNIFTAPSAEQANLNQYQSDVRRTKSCDPVYPSKPGFADPTKLLNWQVQFPNLLSWQAQCKYNLTIKDALIQNIQAGLFPKMFSKCSVISRSSIRPRACRMSDECSLMVPEMFPKMFPKCSRNVP
jgi:hypothetical protein